MFIGNGFGIGVTNLSKQNMGQWHAYTKRDGRGIGVHIYKLLYSITRYDRVYMVFWLYLLVQSTVQWLEKVNQWCRDHGSREIRHSPKSVNGTKWEREREREKYGIFDAEKVLATATETAGKSNYCFPRCPTSIMLSDLFNAKIPNSPCLPSYF